MAKHTEENERLAYSPAESARLIGASRSTLYPLITSGEIPSFKIGRRRLVTRQSLVEFLQRSQEANVAAQQTEENAS